MKKRDIFGLPFRQNPPYSNTSANRPTGKANGVSPQAFRRTIPAPPTGKTTETTVFHPNAMPNVPKRADSLFRRPPHNIHHSQPTTATVRSHRKVVPNYGRRDSLPRKSRKPCHSDSAKPNGRRLAPKFPAIHTRSTNGFAGCVRDLLDDITTRPQPKFDRRFYSGSPTM